MQGGKSINSYPLSNCNVRSHASFVSFVGNAKKYSPLLKKLKNHLDYNTEILGNITSLPDHECK